jgi:hypothetical protein
MRETSPQRKMSAWERTRLLAIGAVITTVFSGCHKPGPFKGAGDAASTDDASTDSTSDADSASEQDASVGEKTIEVCDKGYAICGQMAGCVLPEDKYLEGLFPGARRWIVETKGDDITLTVNLYFDEMIAPGTELVIQAYEPDCTLNKELSSHHLEDIDLFAEAGADHAMSFALQAARAGEHLIELYSDAESDYRITVASH